MGWEKAGSGYWELADTSGGLNASKLTSKVRDNQATDCRNWYYWNGKLRNLFGATEYAANAVNGADVPVSGVAQLRHSSGTDYVVATAGDKIMWLNSGTWTDVTDTLTITAGTKFTFAVMNDTLVATNGVDPVIKWTGTGDAALLGGSPPIAKFVMPYHGFLLLGHCTYGGSTYPVRVRRSDFGTTETWDAANYWSFDNSMQSPLTGMKMLGHRAVIYHRDTISFLSGKTTSTFSLTADAMPGVGCTSHHSIVGQITPRAALNDQGEPTGQLYYQYGHMFRNQDGYHVLDGENVRMVSEHLIDDNSTLNQSELANAVSVYFPTRRQIWNFHSLSGVTTGNGGYLYDTIHGGWWPVFGYNVTAAATIIENGDYKTLLGCSDGKVRYLDTSLYTVDGAVPDNYWYSKWFDFTKPADVKIMRDMMVFIDVVAASAICHIRLEFDLEYSKRSQTGYIDLSGPGGVYPGTYDQDVYYATGEVIRTGRIGGKSFRNMRFKVWMDTANAANIERFGTYLTSIGERRVA